MNIIEAFHQWKAGIPDYRWPQITFSEEEVVSNLRLIKFGDDYYNPEKVIALMKVSEGASLIMEGDVDNVWLIKEDIDIVARKLIEAAAIANADEEDE